MKSKFSESESRVGTVNIAARQRGATSVAIFPQTPLMQQAAFPLSRFSLRIQVYLLQVPLESDANRHTLGCCDPKRLYSLLDGCSLCPPSATMPATCRLKRKPSVPFAKVVSPWTGAYPSLHLQQVGKSGLNLFESRASNLI